MEKNLQRIKYDKAINSRTQPTSFITKLRVRAQVFNATSNNNSVISWWSILLVEETGVPNLSN